MLEIQSGRLEARGRKWNVGSWILKWKVRSRKSKARDQKQETRSRRPKARDQKQETRKRRQKQ